MVVPPLPPHLRAPPHPPPMCTDCCPCFPYAAGDSGQPTKAANQQTSVRLHHQVAAYLRPVWHVSGATRCTTCGIRLELLWGDVASPLGWCYTTTLLAGLIQNIHQSDHAISMRFSLFSSCNTATKNPQVSINWKEGVLKYLSNPREGSRKHILAG